MEYLELLRPHLRYVLLWVVGGAAIGAIIGHLRQATGRGLLLGAILGPIGWVAVGVGAGARRDCPSCSRSIPLRASTCRHCGVDVARYAARSDRSHLKHSSRSGRPW